MPFSSADAATSAGTASGAPCTATRTCPTTAAPVAWHPPVAGAAPDDVLRAFVAPERPWSRGHRGVDLAVQTGAPIQAPAAGRVVFAGVVVDRPVLTLEHEDGTRSSLEPVEADVAVGAVVAAGDPLAEVDFAAIAGKDIDTTVITTVVNSKKLGGVNDVAGGTVAAGDALMDVVPS